MSLQEEDFEVALRPLDLSDFNANLPSIPSKEEHVPVKDSTIFSEAMGLKSQSSLVNHHKPTPPVKSAGYYREQWRIAARKALHLADPWAEFHLEELETEVVLRHRYNAIRNSWVQDYIHVKIAKEPFAHGAMRSCYRLKKLPKGASSESDHPLNWSSASNYVGKCYRQPVNQEIYFQDVRLQMHAKLWGEEYNRHNPPKKVDICQMSVIEFINRPDKPLFHLEHYIEGDYIKYNSNSGFISCDNMRFTPQAFSHFTFERSGHELLVVDIQGVGDLYTDPQIHTANGTDYGDGNLGTRGMALFFHSHVCNPICRRLGLTPFDLAPSEMSTLSPLLEGTWKTQVRGSEEICYSPTPSCGSLPPIMEMLRERSFSGSGSSPPREFFHSSSLPSKDSGCLSISSSSDDIPEDDSNLDYDVETEDFEGDDFHFLPDSLDKYTLNNGYMRPKSRRRRNDSESGSMFDENDCIAFQEQVSKMARPSGVFHEIERFREEFHAYNVESNSILGQIHLDLARYHELERFSAGRLPNSKDRYDHKAALFHLEHAAACNNHEALICAASIYLQMTHDLLVQVTVPATEENLTKGFDYMETAAKAGDWGAMLVVAHAYDDGTYLPPKRSLSWVLARHWYEVALEVANNANSCLGIMDEPDYKILARLAKMCEQGGHGLPQDIQKAVEYYHQAAEKALEAHKGKLATQYFERAESLDPSYEEE